MMRILATVGELSVSLVIQLCHEIFRTGPIYRVRKTSVKSVYLHRHRQIDKTDRLVLSYLRSGPKSLCPNTAVCINSLERRALVFFLFIIRGDEENSACGQLATSAKNERAIKQRHKNIGPISVEEVLRR